MKRQGGAHPTLFVKWGDNANLSHLPKGPDRRPQTGSINAIIVGEEYFQTEYDITDAGPV